LNHNHPSPKEDDSSSKNSSDECLSTLSLNSKSVFRNSIDQKIDLTEYKIGCFNIIQNQFDHMTEGGLFIKGKFSFLSFQEPYAAHTRREKSWESFTKGELDTAIITPVFFKYQIILFDNDLWGGKIVEDFYQYQNGRIISIVLKLDNDE